MKKSTIKGSLFYNTNISIHVNIQFMSNTKRDIYLPRDFIADLMSYKTIPFTFNIHGI